MKQKSHYLVWIIGIVLTILLAIAVQRFIPRELSSAIDPGFAWDEEGKDVQVRLGYEQLASDFVLSIRNISNRVVILKVRVKAYDSEGHDLAERGEGAFQLFLVNAAQQKVSLHQYANRPNAVDTELPITLNPKQAGVFHYHVLPGDNDFDRIGNHGVVAAARYELEPQTAKAGTWAQSKTYVTWSNVVYLPDMP